MTTVDQLRLTPDDAEAAVAALAAAGVTTLADVAARTDAELLALHGVGPKAVRILREHRP